MHLQRHHGSLCEHPGRSGHNFFERSKNSYKNFAKPSCNSPSHQPPTHSPISSSPNPLLTNPKQYCSHRDLNPGLLAPQLTHFSTRPLVSCFSKTKKNIFKCFNFIFQGILGLNVIFDSQKVGKLSYLLW